LACSTVTFREFELPKALEEIASLGLAHVDLGALAGLCEHVPPAGSSAEFRRVARQVAAGGLAVTSENADPGSFTEDQGAVVSRRIARLLDFCAELRLPRLVLPCGGPARPGLAAREQIRVTALTLLRAHDRAQAGGVELVVEAPHHRRIVDSMERTDLLMAALRPCVRQAWDVSHVRAAGEDPAALFGQYVADISIVHLRDAVPGDIRRVLGEGDIDFARVLSVAIAAGYRGPLVLELETRGGTYATKREEARAAIEHVLATVAEVSAR
jgi:sugar phosphate isomerase/epimerase